MVTYETLRSCDVKLVYLILNFNAFFEQLDHGRHIWLFLFFTVFHFNSAQRSMRNRLIKNPCFSSLFWSLTLEDSNSNPHTIATTMVIILDGNSEIGAHVRSNFCYLTPLRHLIRSIAVTNLIFFFILKMTYLPIYVRDVSEEKKVNSFTTKKSDVTP